MKKYLDRKAKMLQKKRDSQSDAAKIILILIAHNPHHQVETSMSKCFKDYFTEGNNTARMLHKSKTSVTGNISADRGGDEKRIKI